MNRAEPEADFDPKALIEFMQSRFGGTHETALSKVSGGQSNPTYYVAHGNQSLVLRKQPNGPILKGAHAIAREYRVLEALHPAGLPVPKPVLFHDDPSVLGTPFYLMEKVDGRIFDECSLPGFDGPERHALWMGLADALATLHNVVPDAVGLETYGRSGQYFERQIELWGRQWRKSDHHDIPELDRLLSWLCDHLPSDDGEVCLAHGDFRMGNMIFHPTEPRVIAILDWELSTLGHPMADLGYCTIPWHSAPDEYGGILGLAQTTPGLPYEEEFVARYFASSRFDMPLLPFHQAFALFRFAVIFVGIADRARHGNAAGTNVQALAPLAYRFAVRGLEAAKS